MSNLAKIGQSSALSTWDESQVSIIKQQIAKGCSDGELALFSQVCTKTGLDPFSRQIYAISRNVWDKETGKSEPKMTIQVSIDGFRTIAARSGLYGGSITEWCGTDAVWREVWLSSSPPAAAKTTVWRVGSPMPFTGVARFDAYAQSFKGKLSGLWEKMPDILIAKCSESLALRKAFPAELSGLYTTEEMQQADATPAPAQYSDNIKQYQQALADCMVELGWDGTKKAKWAKSVCDRPFSNWTANDWQGAVVKAHLEIDKLNESSSRIDAISAIATESDIY